MLEYKKADSMTIKNSEIYISSKTKVDKFCYLFLIFLLGCFIGWIYEEIFYWITEGMLQNRGILYGPWLPIYGIGALGIYFLKPLKKYPVLLFLLCIAVTGVVEYIIGFLSIKLFGLRLWDYHGLFLNIGGIICLRSVVSFGIMGLLFHYILEPIGKRLYDKVPFAIIKLICLVFLLLLLIDCVLSFLFRTPITYKSSI